MCSDFCSEIKEEEQVKAVLPSPVLVALYMFSMGKAEPRPYSNTLERAGMSCVVVTNTFTQLGLEQGGTDTFILDHGISEETNKKKWRTKTTH